MSTTEVETNPDATKNADPVKLSTPESSDEIIIRVSKQLASMSLGFSIDCGNSVTKLVYRSKQDYENGQPKDMNNGFGTLRLRYMKYGDINNLVDFLKTNCDMMDTRHGQKNGLTNSSITWSQIGISYQTCNAQLEHALNIRTNIHNESDIQMKGLKNFYSPVNSSENIQQCLSQLPPKTVDGARQKTILRMKTFEAFKKLGEKAFGEMMSKPREGFNLEEFKAKLVTIGEAELAEEMTVKEIKYPCILVVMGSTTVIYSVNANETMSALNFLPSAGKSFISIGKTLTGAKDFNELCEMAGRGKPHKVDTMSGDLTNKTRNHDDFYNVWLGEANICTLGKLADEKYKGTYCVDDIAASLVLSTCTATANSVAMLARQENLNSVLFVGSFLCHPAIRDMMEASMAVESLLQPFIGGDLLKIAILPNPGFLGALGTWQVNFETEQRESANQKASQ